MVPGAVGIENHDRAGLADRKAVTAGPFDPDLPLIEALRLEFFSDLLKKELGFSLSATGAGADQKMFRIVFYFRSQRDRILSKYGSKIDKAVKRFNHNQSKIATRKAD
jgi:hypothetical protein